MGLKKSYLSKKTDGVKQYNADMVTVISEASLNSQMRAYLSHCDWKKTVYFLKAIDDNGSVVLFMLDEHTNDHNIPQVFELGDTVSELKGKGSSVYKELNKLNLFCLTSGARSTDSPAIDAAMSYSLGFGIRLEDGIPDEIMGYLVRNKGKVNPDDILKIITINPQNNSVLFKQFFKNIEIVQLNTQIIRGKAVGILSVNRQTCSIKNPTDGLWFATCSIEVDLRETSHKDIVDEKIRKRIQAMSTVPNPDTVFDISQLVLDLSTLQTVSLTTIEGLAPECRETVKTLIATYFDRLEQAGQTIFGHIILPKPNINVNYLFTPTIRNFAAADKAFYYLINFKDDRDPVLPNLGNNRDFEWKPLLDNSVTADGAMIINATKFIPILRSRFEPVLKNLAINIHPYIETGVYKFNIICSRVLDPSEQKLCVDTKEPWKTTWNYRCQYNQDWQLMPAPPVLVGATGKIDSDYQAACHTEIGTLTVDGITYPSYDFVINVNAWLNFGYNSKGNSGCYYNKTLRFQIGIKLDADGNFKLLGKTTITDNKPAGINISGWGEFCTFGTLSGIVSNLTDYINSMIERLSSLSVDDFLSGTNTFTGWFLPGCRTFTYKNEGLSDYGDLYAYVNYVQE